MATVSPPTFLTIFFLYFIFSEVSSNGNGRSSENDIINHSNINGGILKHAEGQAEGQGSWCVAKPSSSDIELQNDIEFACKFVSCNIIQPGGPCFEPQTLINHASVVMNLYYQVNERHSWNCDFTNSGIIAVKDPSYGDCKYQ